MIKAVTETPRAIIWAINKLKKTNEDSSKLQKRIDNWKLTKPKIADNFKCEINSICVDYKKNNKFDFIQLKSIGKSYGKIRIPIAQHRQSKKWSKKGEQLNSYLLGKNCIDLRYDVLTPEVKTIGETVGADQGKLTCLSMSDGQITGKNKDGYDLNVILKILERRKKGSKGFKQGQEHRKNYINWSINRLNLDNIKKINLEKVRDLRKGKTSSRLMSHWTYPLIKDKLIRTCEEQKVSVSEQSCVYRSQRCNQCGLVRKLNRKGKLYLCNGCGYVGDADINASLNHEIELPDIDDLRGEGHNILGFYWLESGVYDLNHKELTVPYCNKTIDL